MDSWKRKLIQATETIQPQSDGLSATYQLASRQKRSQRMLAGVVGMGLGAALITGLIAISRDATNSRAAAGISAFHVSGRVLAAGESNGSVWVLTCTNNCTARSSGGRLVRLDRDMNQVGPSVDLRSPSGLAVDDAGEWVISASEGTVTHIDADGNVLSSTQLQLPKPIEASDTAFIPKSIAVGEGAVWVASDRGELARLDPVSGAVQQYIALPPDELGGNLVTGFGSVWLAMATQVTQLDPSTNQILTTIPIVRDALTLSPTQIAVAGSDLWVSGEWAQPVTDEAGNTSLELTGDWAVASIDPTSGRVTSITDVPGGTSFVTGAGQVWLVDGRRIPTWQVRDGRLARTFEFRGKLVAVSSDRVWVLTRGGVVVVRSTAG